MTAVLFPRWLIFILIWSLPDGGWSQTEIQPGIAWVDSVLNVIIKDQSIDSKTKSDLADSAFQICIREKDICKQIYTRTAQATHLDNLGLADSALTQLYWAYKAFQPKCDSIILMLVFTNLTNIYLSLGELTRVDSVGQIVLNSWNPAWKDKEPRFATLTNLAISYAQRSEITIATEYFRQAYTESEEEKNQKYVQISLNNLGSLKGMIGELDSAYYFLSTAASKAKEEDDMDNYMSLLINLANLDVEKGRYNQAINLLDLAYILADSLKSTEKLAQVERTRANVYAGKNDFKKAHSYLLNYLKLNEQYLNEERVKAVTEMMEKYESEKKARQIQQLELDKLDATLTNIRITNTRNRYLYGGVVILLLAIGLTSRLRYVNKSKVAIQKEKDISEGLLLNILPASVADELKQKGYAEAMQYDVATILFSDFKEFTTVAENMSAAELVKEINACFKAFDEIMTRRGIEKIKTIGDAYMAAGGLPDNNTATTIDVILAGLEMQQFIISRKKERDEQQLTAFDMRVGIHSGPVVAGIVGVKKFQYDLWGDTVNIASRMETSGETRRVNISDATYQLVKDADNLLFTPRGMIHAKGKGEMAMYFVEAKTTILPDIA